MSARSVSAAVNAGNNWTITFSGLHEGSLLMFVAHCGGTGLNDYLLAVAEKQIYLAFEHAQNERELLSKRTSEGLKQAKLMGSKVGRQKGQKIVTRKQLRAKRIIRKYYTLFGGYLSATETYTLAKITKSTFYRYLEQIYEEDKSKGIEWDRDFIPEEDKNVALETITQKIMAHKQHKEKET